MRKGQAAMEFLMTYGWAILVVLAAIGALAYFGVLSPSRFLPSNCDLGIAGVSCADDFKVDGTAGTIDIIVRNGRGDSITFTQMDIGTCTSPVNAAPVTIADGDAATIQFTVCTPGNVGDKYKETISSTYNVGSSTIAHTGTGSIAAKVE